MVSGNMVTIGYLTVYLIHVTPTYVRGLTVPVDNHLCEDDQFEHQASCQKIESETLKCKLP